MLEVSSSLVAAVAMLECIVMVCVQFQLDGLNDPTLQPILKGNGTFGEAQRLFKCFL